MSDERPSDVLGALPRRRPHRRSDKRAAPRQTEQPAGTQVLEADRPNQPAKKRVAKPATPALKPATPTATAKAETGAAKPTTPAATSAAKPATSAVKPGKSTTAAAKPRAAGAGSGAPKAGSAEKRRATGVKPATAKPRPTAITANAASPPPRVKPRTGKRGESDPLRQPAQPPGSPPTPREREPSQQTGRDILGTAAQAAAELAEIGISASARALRNAVGRLPRP